MRYHGITYWPALPLWVLGLWKRIMCRRNCHVFDEVVSSGDHHYLICDACQLVVNIASIEGER